MIESLLAKPVFQGGHPSGVAETIALVVGLIGAASLLVFVVLLLGPYELAFSINAARHVSCTLEAGDPRAAIGRSRSHSCPLNTPGGADWPTIDNTEAQPPWGELAGPAGRASAPAASTGRSTRPSDTLDRDHHLRYSSETDRRNHAGDITQDRHDRQAAF